VDVLIGGVRWNGKGLLGVGGKRDGELGDSPARREKEQLALTREEEERGVVGAISKSNILSGRKREGITGTFP